MSTPLSHDLIIVVLCLGFFGLFLVVGLPIFISVSLLVLLCAVGLYSLWYLNKTSNSDRY